MDDNQHTNPNITVLQATVSSDRPPVPRRQLRVAAYCRVSTNDEEQLTSYEAQKTYYTDKIMTNPEWSLAGIFADEGISGLSTKKRLQFLKMIRMCQKQKIDLILTKSVSRFARNTVDCLDYVRMLKELHIGILFEKENINTLTSDSEILLTMLGGFAQAESESISHNVKWGLRQAMKEGKVSFQFERMYGYERGENNTPHIVPEQAEVVRRIFQSYLDGKSAAAICQMLKDDNVLTSEGKEKWSISAIQYILKNEKYCGDVLMQKTFVQDCLSKKSAPNHGQLPKYLLKDHHEAIISHEIFDLTQTEIARRSSLRKSTGKTGELQPSKYNGKYALTGRVFCRECGSDYRRVTWTSSGEKKAVWRCVSRLSYGKKYCKHSPTVEEGKIQAAILHAIAVKKRRECESDGIQIKRMPSTPISSQCDGIISAFASRVRQLQDRIMELVRAEAADENVVDFHNQVQTLLKEATTLYDQFKMLSRQANTERVSGPVRLSPEIDIWDESAIRQSVDSVQIVNTEKILIVFKDQTKIEEKL